MSGSSRLIIMVISFITSVFSTRLLGVELKGQFSYLVTISGFVWMVLDLGLYRSFPYLVRKYPEHLGSLFHWIVLQFLVNLSVLTTLGFCLMSLVSGLMDITFSPLYMFLFVCLISFSQLSMQLQSLYLGLNKIWQHSLANLLNAIVMLLLITLGFALKNHLEPLIFVLGATVIGTIITIMYYISKHDWSQLSRKIDLSFVNTSYKYGFRVFLSTIIIMLLIRADIIIIKHFLSFKEVGIYSIAAHIIDMLQIASNVVGGLLLVKLSDSKSDIDKWLIMKKLLMSFFVLLFCANLGFVIFGKFMIANLYGVQFVPVYSVYLWLIPASFGLSFGSLFNMYLNSKGFPVISIVLPAISLILNIILNYLLIPVWGIKGSALATSVAYILWFVLIVLYEQKQSKNELLKYIIPDRQDWHNLFQEGMKLISELKSKLLAFLSKKQ